MSAYNCYYPERPRIYFVCIDDWRPEKGKTTDYVARQYIGNGKTENGIVSVNAYGF